MGVGGMKERTSVQYQVDKLICYSKIIKQYLPLPCSARSVGHGDARESQSAENEDGSERYQ